MMTDSDADDSVRRGAFGNVPLMTQADIVASDAKHSSISNSVIQ
jgi:hypothetical protein